MRIITVSREFGSGGRELAKRLAEKLGYDYYDKEIIKKIAENKELDSSYVESILNSGTSATFPITVRNTFAMSSMYAVKTALMVEEKNVLESIAERGNDCVIVGRNADVILSEYHPFNLFVYADMEAKLARCVKHAPEDENLTEKELKNKMLKVDKARKETRRIVTDKEWGSKESYHLMINSTGWEIKKLVPVVEGYAKAYFEERED